MRSYFVKAVDTDKQETRKMIVWTDKSKFMALQKARWELIRQFNFIPTQITCKEVGDEGDYLFLCDTERDSP